MIPTYNHRFLLVTRLRGTPLPPAQLRERLNSILDQQLESRCWLLFCDDGQNELGWLIHSGQDYRTLDASLSRLALPDCPELSAAGLCLERFELFEQYEQLGLGSAWRWCWNLIGRMRLRLLMQV
ncbi:hypothetical protein [Pseudomonas chlororaphis]|uniref:Uncharacterized protein n=1 Tax=Pseudomonas chlororaphis subsp. aureofaciens TaxID=587851 RepID=A0AAD1E601_9PSED|nr:hypothetical protein [Pseudomonas chlororaphis]AZD79353.1 hypothetical protein C4K15_2786 [Pseudomonas chlororaphis subsp. aurantiaca]AZE04928.1 hypothetical protein C4K11_2766 [Pseudomonas chlororaphis subsp. aureofaciens]AZE29553.1 hypothetical protein C4K07_2768 [Pseudomonas chlororaphis subsp. aureofaciens]KAA5844591.1 hypothetical protein F2A37_13575 [Pseudomonas chlororaphis]MBP5064906.1 hypothetical protein [Pseudomonas chlororaphis]